MTESKSNPTARPPLDAVRAAWLLAPPLIVMAVIFTLSAQPSLLPTHGFWETLVRKSFHAFEYLVLTLCWVRALHGLRPAWAVAPIVTAAIGLTLLYACSDEFHQRFVTGRHGAPSDVAIDAVGIAIAALAVMLYARRRSVGPSRPSAA